MTVLPARATVGSLAAASLIDDISCSSPVTAELAKMAAAVTLTDRRSVVMAGAGHADRSQLRTLRGLHQTKPRSDFL
eukprot:1147507-Prymnesium_polylepis.1